MIVFGLTGSIGMGKSRAAQMLRRLGVPVHDSDAAVHTALQKGPAAEKVKALFPQAVAGGAIDRGRLGQIVFKDEAALKRLESILHPAARASQQKFIRSMAAMGKKAVALEIPLLFETGAQDRVDYVICVSAPRLIQRRRVLSRPGMSEEKFESILARQVPDSEKRALSDFIVPTGLGQALTYRSLQEILRQTGAG